MSTPAINLNSGLVPKNAAPAATSPATSAPTTPGAASPNLDLSAGMVQRQGGQPTPREAGRTVYDENAAWEDIKSVGQAGAHVLSGVGGAALDTLETVGAGVDKVATLGMAPKSLTTPSHQFAENRNTGESVGSMIENVGEFILGEEALKGLSVADKMRKLAPVAKIMEKYPKLAELVSTGMRQGATGTAQAAAHGASPKEAAISGGVAGVTGAATEGVANKLKGTLSAVKPSEVTIAGEKMPKLASQEAGAKEAATRAATITHEPEIAAAQQKGSQQAIKNIARKAAKDSAGKLPSTETLHIRPADYLKRVGADEASILKTDADKETVDSLQKAMREGKDIPQVEIKFDDQGNIVGGDGRHRALAALKEGTERIPVTATREGGAGALVKEGEIHSFRDAADQVKQAAKPVFDKLDKVSDNSFTELNNSMKDAQQRMMKATSRDAYAEARSEFEGAQGQMEQLFKDHEGVIGKKDMQAAKSAWRDAAILNKVHAAVEGAFNGVPEEIASRAGVQRGLAGGMLQRRLGNLLGNTKQADVERVIGKEGIDNLYRIADLTSTPARKAQFGEVLQTVARYIGRKSAVGAVGGFLGHASGVGVTAGVAASETADEGMRRLLHWAAVNPTANKWMTYAVQKGVRPEVYGPLLANEYRKSNEE